ncbi:UPF0276 protein [Bacterioplanes sanyensis]|uniref:HvfB family MNIO-type RiPP peptide maturase n=1 Tax=Bacterioplanes sanyensis TaxID=1249553 RepID=UPI001677B8D9|nr:DUF692 domain-containing protein [Bacterioplanes sanyensis]GGY40770.1 UPF0276 protein [Bacterioplanes sanyensis]
MSFPVQGAGLGLRRGLMDELKAALPAQVDFMEIAPENWMRMGGRLAKSLREFTERYDFLCHGLSLSLGSPDPLDEDFIRDVGAFLRTHKIKAYSEHLSYCGAGGHMYDLMPIPFTTESVRYVSERIQRVQEILGQRLIIENVSAYAEPGKRMEEIEFVTDILKSADCDLLLDVNNVFVNCRNHGGDPYKYITAMPTERIRYCHIAGHFEEADDLLVDTHGMTVKDDVWRLLEFTYQQHGVIPTLLERDFNFPPLAELLQEVDRIHAIQDQVARAEQVG